jgi:hypothetical protein
MANDIHSMERRLGCDGLDLASDEGSGLADVTGMEQSQAVGENQVSHLAQAALKQMQGSACAQVAVDEEHRRSSFA